MDASGNVFTTGDDMTKWMRWHLAVNDAAAAEVRMIDHVPYRWHDGLKAAVGVGKDMDALGLGWFFSLPREQRPLIMAKSGGIAGFMTYVVLAPTRGVGVFVAVNRLNFSMFEGLTSAALRRSGRALSSRPRDHVVLRPLDHRPLQPSGRSFHGSARECRRDCRRRRALDPLLALVPVVLRQGAGAAACGREYRVSRAG
jgi:CubicO group peptidase (beta-lactamase class C family)